MSSVEHFRNLLQLQAKNLTKLCNQWTEVLDNCQQEDVESKDEEVKSEDYVGAIRTTIGQAKLLMSQRFKQFSELIDHCEFNTGKLPIRLNDLSGFWEMISLQVEDIVQKFNTLDRQKNEQEA